jgi:GTP cyclohydrolase II
MHQQHDEAPAAVPAAAAPAAAAPAAAPAARTGFGAGNSPLPVASVRTTVQIPLDCGAREPIPAQAITFARLVDDQEHIAVRLGRDRRVPLVRLHSECLTGDVLGSVRCDCGPQLREAVRRINSAGGVLLYLRQEGRGIGLYNKLDAYRLQDHGLDTYAANRALGLADDLRDYAAAAQMLHALGCTEIDLLTNNPDKRSQLAGYGITVRRTVGTGVFANPHNAAYLVAKAVQTSHTLRLKEMTV